MKTFKISVTLLFFLIDSLSFYGQIIKGRIVDKNHSGIGYATIRLMAGDSLFSATISDTSGHFTLSAKNIKNKNYTLCIDCFGFVAKKIDASHIKRKMGDIILQRDVKVLKTIKIIGEKDKKTVLSAKTILRIDTNLSKSSANLMDYMNKTQDIIVDKKNKEVTIAGKNGHALILINGALSDVSDLSTITPNEVERIEILKNSSVKYGADTKGVINIILKKRKTGYYIDTKIDYSTNLRDIGPYVNLRYTKEKISYFLHYGYGYNNAISTSNTNNFYKESGYRYNANEQYNIHKTNHNLKYGVDFFFNKRNILQISGKNKFLNNVGSGTMLSQFIGNDTVKNTFFNKWTGNINNNNYSLFYKHIFKDTSEILCDFNFYLFEGNFFDYYTNRTDVTSNKKISNYLRIEYDKKISKKLSVNMGYNLYNRNIDNSFKNSLSNIYLKYTEYRNAIYLQNNFVFSEKLSADIGGRYEYSNITLFDNQKKYFNILIPTFDVMYSLNKKNSFNLSLNKEINYPVYTQLEPFPFYSGDSLYYTVGNPNLGPEQLYILDFDYNLFVDNDFFFTLSVFYNPTKDIIGNIRTVENNNILRETYKNIFISVDKGVSLSLTYKPTSFWYINFYDKLAHYSIKSDKFHNEGYNNSLYMYNQFSLPKKNISIGISFMITPKSYELQGYTDANYYLPSDMFVSKSIFKGNGSVTLGWAFPFNDFGNKAYYADNQLMVQSKTGYTFQCVYLIFTYTLFKGENKNIDKKLFNEDDINK